MSRMHDSQQLALNFDRLRQERRRDDFVATAERLAQEDPQALLRMCLPQASPSARAALLHLDPEDLVLRPCFGATGATLTLRSARGLELLLRLGMSLGRGLTRLVVVPGLGQDQLPALLQALPLAGLTALRLDGQGLKGQRAIISQPEGKVVRLRFAGDDKLVRAILELPRLQDLRLCDNRIGPAGAAALSRHPALRRLDLRGNAVGDEGAAALSQHPGLQELRLEDNCLTELAALALSEGSLSSLDLSRNPLGDEGAAALALCRGLRRLKLRCCAISDEGALTLARALPAAQLDLRGNPLSTELRLRLREAGAQADP